MNYSSMAGYAYHSEAIGAQDNDYRVYGDNLRVNMEADLASYARIIQEREAELRDLYVESPPQRRTIHQQHNIECLKEEIQQLHDEVMALQTDLADLCSYTPSTPSFFPDHDSPYDVYHDSELDDEDDYGHDEWEEYYDPEMYLWSSQSSGGMGFEPEGEGMSARRGVSDDELENLPTLMCFGMRIVGEDEEGLEDTTTSKTINSESTHRRVLTRSSIRRIPQSYPDESPVEEVRRKMRRAAIPGQAEVLAHVKYLVTLAHRTPAYLRTEAQRVLLFEWRRPPPPPPSIFERPFLHAYVDASGHGIGFYLEGLWQSWRLKQCWWKDKDANTQWSEALAVELGLRLLIETGLTAQGIVIYSDNIGAVDALQFGDTRRLHVGPVVNRILSLCETYRLYFSVQWVPGAENPADVPSRFRRRDGRRRFPYDIDIPHHLQRFVAPYYL